MGGLLDDGDGWCCLPNTSRQNERDPGHDVKVGTVCGQSGVQCSGQAPGGVGQTVGEFRRRHTRVLLQQFLSPTGSEPLLLNLSLTGTVCLGLAGA
ncbi:hypothetical protein BU52_32155 [Streptomyces toyocaensis]|uniref:Uncharacterized protein n=1 Tax=Streptomyces toyocaensis TaxID=55952 RepID=A0A081XHT4_STRTO|nr:hypothetical protein [Streptomyces toyocaensis]KES03107.1 hypothetical protein BU52_32155 [Streptomyces toyocaensis]